eukprot:330536-Hanusia_phi.AAC.2
MPSPEGSNRTNLFIHGVAGCLNLFQFDMKSVVQLRKKASNGFVAIEHMSTNNLLPALFEVASQSAVSKIVCCFARTGVMARSPQGGAVEYSDKWKLIVNENHHDLVQDRLGGKVSLQESEGRKDNLAGKRRYKGSSERSFRTQLDSSKPSSQTFIHHLTTCIKSTSWQLEKCAKYSPAR